MSDGGAQFWKHQYISSAGVPYAGAKVFHYSAGTTTLKNVWVDEARVTPAAQPFLCDASGIAKFYADGDYHLVVQDSSSNVLPQFDWDNYKITSDTSAMWEGNQGTSYPPAVAANRWQLAVKHTAGDVLQEVGINEGAAFRSISGGALPVYTKAALPSTAFVGQRAVVSNDVQGIWRYTGSKWTPITSGSVYFASDYVDFNAAVSAIGATIATLVIDSDLAISVSVTSPSTLTLHFVGQGKLSPATTKVVTVNGSVIAEDLRQVFNCVGSETGIANLKFARVRWFGATGDGTTEDINAVKSTIGSLVTDGLLLGEPGDTYNFGTIAGEELAIIVTKSIVMDWQWAKLLCAGTDGAFSDSTLFRYNDSVARIHNFIFEDSLFVLGVSLSRGVMPVSVRNTLLNTRGYRIGPAHVIKGQSFLTMSTADVTKRASDIQLIAPLTGESMYYGLSLAKNGDNVRGSYSVDAYNRLIFIYDLDDMDVVIHGGANPRPTSANILISNDGSVDTTNIRIRAVLEKLNGLIEIRDFEGASGGSGVLKNIDLTVDVGSYGTSLPDTSDPIVAIGALNQAGSFIATSNSTMENIRVNFTSATRPTIPIRVMTSSPNYGTLETPGLKPVHGSIAQSFLLKKDPFFLRRRTGMTLASESLLVDIPFIVGVKGPDVWSVEVEIVTRKDVSAGLETLIEKHIIRGSTNSLGYITIDDDLTLHTKKVGTDTPAIVIAAVASSPNMDVSVTGYTTTVGHLFITVRSLS